VKTNTKILLHLSAIFIETVGTFFVFLDTVRLDARSPVNGITLGDPVGYGSWYYHFGIEGFILLFLGIIFQTVLIFFHDAELENIERRIERIEQSKEHPPESSKGEK